MISRRKFVKAMCAGVALIGSCKSFGQQDIDDEDPYVLDIQRNKERYLIDLRTAEGRTAVAWLLRDITAGNIVGRPNWDTLRLAAWAQACMAAHGTHTVLDIHSGLRLKSTNNRLERAVQNSRHLPDRNMNFWAMDVFPFGTNKDYFGRLLATPKFGGVGWYDTHIHFDRRPAPAYWVDHRPSH